MSTIFLESATPRTFSTFLSSFEDSGDAGDDAWEHDEL